MSVKGDDVFMRILVFFDLPVNKTEQRRVATRFRKDLIDDGYTMLQFSVYCRVCRGQDIVDRQIKRLKKIIPEEGNVRVLQVTDKQYGSMLFLVGEQKKEEKFGAEQLLLF